MAAETLSVPWAPFVAQVIESQPHLTASPQPHTFLVSVPTCCVWALPEFPHPLHHAGNRVLCLAPSSAQITAQKMSLMSAPGESRVLPQLSFGPAEAPGCFLEVPSPQPTAALGSARHKQIFLPLLLPSPRNTTGSGTPRSHPPSCSNLTFAIVCWMFFLPPPPAIRSPKPLAAERGGGTGEGLCPCTPAAGEVPMLGRNFLPLPVPHHVPKAGQGVCRQRVRAAFASCPGTWEREVPAHVSCQGGCWHRELAAGKGGGNVCRLLILPDSASCLCLLLPLPLCLPQPPMTPVHLLQPPTASLPVPAASPAPPHAAAPTGGGSVPREGLGASGHL